MWLPTPAKLPPGPSSKSWTGTFKEYSRDPLGYLQKLSSEYGDIVTMRYYNLRFYLVNHPDFIEEVLVTQNRKFIKGRVLRANKRLFGNGLLTSEGDFWLRQRRLAQPAFHRSRVASYAHTMVHYTERVIAEWKSGEERNVHAEMMRLTLQIVAKTLFDADVDSDAGKVGAALEAIMELNSDFRKLIADAFVVADSSKPSRRNRDPPPEQNYLSFHRAASRQPGRQGRPAFHVAGGSRRRWHPDDRSAIAR